MEICPYCHTGRIEPRKAVYVQYHTPDLIVVDRIPALVCDNCGEKSYDPDALKNLQQLLWSTSQETWRPQSPLINH